MLCIIDKSNCHLHSDALRSFAALRYEVFVRRRGWKIIGGEDGYEQDQFDTEDGVYLVRKNAKGVVVGGARLLDTSRRSLLAEVFPYLVHGRAPRDPRVFEVTRFVVDPRREQRQGCGNVCEQLLWAMREYGAWAGLSHLVSVSYLSLEPILRRAGYGTRRLGKSFVIDGVAVAALEHEIDPISLQHGRGLALSPRPTLGATAVEAGIHRHTRLVEGEVGA